MSDQVITPSARAAPSIPDYELLRPIGRGAYGEVWLARNVTGSWVALKIIHRSAFDHDRPFEREFEGIKRFEPISRSDPSQVAILHVGLGEGFFYYVMELADDVAAEVTRLNSKTESGKQKAETSQGLPMNLEVGRVTPCAPQLATHPSNGAHGVTRPTNSATYQPKTLKRLLNDRGHLPSGECLAIALSLTRALAHLHGNGLVHRDVKPSNVIFVNGVAKLADIGLVTSVDATRSFVGTEGYLPPEGAGTPQADLYSLGKLLYEMSTGRDRREFPALPPDIATRPDRSAIAELNAIVVRACQLDPRERYASVGMMHADFELLRRGQSVKGQHTWQRALSHAKKLALAVGALAVVSAVLYSLAPLVPRSSSFKGSPVAEANDEYKRGMDELHLNLNATEAVKHFEKATQLDPKFANAYAQLADAWFSIPGETNSRKGQEAAEKAVKLDSQSGLAHVTFAAAKTFTLDFEAAERENRLGVKLSPDSEQVLLISALSFAVIGRTNEARASLKKAIDIGRNTPSKLRVIYAGFVYGWCRRYDDAIKLYDANPWLKDDVDSPHFVQAQCYLAKKDYPNAMRLGRQSALESGGDPKQVKAEFDALETALRQGGHEGYWRQRLEIESSKTGDYHWMYLAAIHAHLNEPDKAIEYLRRAKQETPLAFAMEIYTDSSFDSLRKDSQSVKELIDELWHKK